MKYKLVSIGAILLMLCFVFAIQPLTKTGATNREKRIHQHLEKISVHECNHDTNTFCTHLPLINISTQGNKIPGTPILDSKLHTIGFETGDQGEEMITVNISITDNKDGKNHLSGSTALETKALFRIRGNSSRFFDKKSYLIRLVDDKGQEEKHKIMGMSSHNEWALYGPFLDKTLMRNYMWMNISGEIFEYAPNVRNCEVFLNGEYQGVYVMMETVARGTDRVRLRKYKRSDVISSYIARLDTYDEEDVKCIDNFTHYTLNTEYGNGISIVYPAKKYLNDELKTFIEKDISQFEKALYSYDFKSGKKGYRAYIDVDSFVDFYVLSEFLCQNDMCSKSTYIFKDLRGKITLSPIWDLNNVLNNYLRLDYDGSGFFFTERTWYKMLIRDEYFVKKVISRYKELRTTFLNEEYLLKYIDETSDYLGLAVDRNYSVWGYSFLPENQSSYNSRIPKELNPKNYQDAILEMKEFIIKRGNWMDKNIETLYQHCHESKIKQFIK